MPWGAERGEIGLLVALGDEAVVIDAVIGDDHLGARVNEDAEPFGGVLAHAHQHRRPACRRPDHPPEVHDLVALMPLGMVEEREVVDRHDAGHARAQRHRVVGTVPYVGSHASGERTAARLLPRQAERTPDRCGVVDLRCRRDRPPSLSVVAAGEEVQVNVASGVEARSQGHGVAPGAHGPRGNGGDIEEDPHESQLTRARRAGAQPRCDRSTIARAYAAAWDSAECCQLRSSARARPRSANSVRSSSSPRSCSSARVQDSTSPGGNNSAASPTTSSRAEPSATASAAPRRALRGPEDRTPRSVTRCSRPPSGG